MLGFNEFIRYIEGAVVLAGVAGLVFALFKSGTTKATIQSQKELIETLTSQVSELRNLHIENEKAISELKGQVSVYKELPLKDLAKSMGDMSKSQKEILKILQKSKGAVL